MHLKNKIVLITGSSMGIGKSIAEKFSREGAATIITSRDFTKIKKISEKIKNSYPLELDVTNKQSVKKAVKQIITKFKKIDILINNAGIAEYGKVADVDYVHFETQIKTNLLGTICCTKEVLPYMIKQKSGKIINISSGSGKKGAAETSAYCASKFGVVGFTESIAEEFKQYNINVHLINPGKVNTTIHKIPHNDSRREKMLLPEDIANTCAFLAKLPERVDIREMNVKPWRL